MSMQFSAITITRNEEANIERCLRSLAEVTDDIIVVDSGSIDRTTELASKFTQKIFERRWDGFGQARNFAATKAEHQWILALDADEELSEALINSLKSLDPKPETVYALDRINLFGEQWIRHGSFYPDWKIRLYPKALEWSHDAVHETLEYPSSWRVIRLRGKLRHYTAPDPATYARKMDRYARLAASDLKAKGRRVPLLVARAKAAFRFFSSYILKLGVLDGGAGWRLAVLEAKTVFKRYVYLRRMWKAGKVDL